MFSFAEENRACLLEFFTEAVQSRRNSILHPGGTQLLSWIDDEAESNRLRCLLPVLTRSLDHCTGIHAEAYIFDNAVVKTNVFDEFYHDGQTSWLKWCLSHQCNPLVPRLSFLIIDEETERYLAVMERLVPHSGFEYHSFREEIDGALKSLFQAAGAGPAFRRELGRYEKESLLAIQELETDLEMMDPEEDGAIIDSLSTAVAEHRITIRYINELNQFDFRMKRTHRKHFKAIRNKFHAAKHDGRSIDVHGFNWMMRNNGEPVILDPIN